MHGPSDVVVVGGGPAGLAAALWAARYRRRVVLVDAGEQRNRWTAASHGYLGLDGIAPVEFLERARRDLSGYANSGTKRAHVSNVEGSEGAFGLELETGEHLTSVAGVYAAGDVTPGPHLVQVAAAKGAIAGIAAAESLRGDRGAPTSPRPAPDPEARPTGSPPAP